MQYDKGLDASIYPSAPKARRMHFLGAGDEGGGQHRFRSIRTASGVRPKHVSRHYATADDSSCLWCESPEDQALGYIDAAKINNDSSGTSPDV